MRVEIIQENNDALCLRTDTVFAPLACEANELI